MAVSDYEVVDKIAVQFYEVAYHARSTELDTVQVPEIGLHVVPNQTTVALPEQNPVTEVQDVARALN